MKSARNIAIFLALLLLAIYFIARCFVPPVTVTEEKKTDTITHVIKSPPVIYHDTVYLRVTKVNTVTEIKEVPVPVKVDTATIISAYFKEKIYARQYMDTSYSVQWTDTIGMNYLKGGSDMRIKDLRTHTVRTVTVTTKSRNKLFIGAGFDTEGENMKPEVSLLFLTKNDKAVSVSNHILDGQPNFGVNVYFKMRLKK